MWIFWEADFGQYVEAKDPRPKNQDPKKEYKKSNFKASISG
jgi:hypothetical protein